MMKPECAERSALERSRRWLKRGSYLNKGLCLNAIMLPVIATSPYSTISGHWFWDILQGTAFGGVYWFISKLPFVTHLRHHAFYAPHLSVAPVLLISWHIGAQEPLLKSALLIYPLMPAFHMLPVMAWVVTLAIRKPKASRGT